MRTAAGRAIGLGAAIAATIAAPATIAAHGLDTTYQSRLPLAVYLVGAGLAVALSFAFVLLRDLRAEAAPPGEASVPPAALRVALRLIGIAGWGWIMAQGIAGGSSAGDVGYLFVWVYAWVGIAIVSALLFPVWHWLDPFATLHDAGAWLMRRLGIRGWEVAEYPRWLGRWPAVAGMVFVIWLELVLRTPGGRTLFVVVAGYTAFTLAMMAQFGRDTWRANGEFFNVWFRLLNRLAPWTLDGAGDGAGIRRRAVPSGLLEPGWTRTDIILISLGTGSILFDGLTQTQPWFEIFGFPTAPLLTIQLLVFLAIVAAAAMLVARLVGVASTAAGLLPIAVGYLVAHYLTFLLIDGQRFLIAVSDPFQQGENYFGTAFWEPNAAFLPPGLVWTVQLVAVVGGHMVGAWAGHVAAAREAGGDVRLRQVPLAAVMVALTTLTLWSLGQAIVVTPDEAGALAALIEPG